METNSTTKIDFNCAFCQKEVQNLKYYFFDQQFYYIKNCPCTKIDLNQTVFRNSWIIHNTCMEAFKNL